MHLSPKVIDFASKHHGLVTLTAWTDAGGSERTFHRARKSGALPVVCPQVSVLPGRPIGPLQRIEAGVLYFGPDRVAVSHPSAIGHGAPR